MWSGGRTPKQWAPKRWMAPGAVSYMPSGEAGRGSCILRHSRPVSGGREWAGCNHRVPDGREGTLEVPLIQLLWPLWSLSHVKGVSWSSEMTKVFGLWGRRGRYPGLTSVGARCFREPRHSEQVSLMLGVPGPVLRSSFHSLSPWFPNADPQSSDFIMTFSTDCS